MYLRGVLLVLAMVGVVLAAEPDAPAAPAAVVGPVLPSVVSTVQGAYPPRALAVGQDATLLVDLAVGLDGSVTGAAVREGSAVGCEPGARSFLCEDPVWEEFDAAALDAVRQFRFTPARDETGAPVTAVITWRFVFDAERAPPPIATAPPPPEPPPPPPVGDEEIDATITVQAVERSADLTERTLTVEEIQYLPGTGGDVVRAVQNLPGVARAPLGVGQLIIRGTPPEDSRYFLDGSRVPIVFHFAGFSTVLNADSIAEVAYLPGNYSVRYGRTLGGVVDLRTKDDLPTAHRGYVSADLIQATAFIEQPLGDRWALTVSGRRSYVDAILNPVLNSVSAAPIRAPRYYDAQARLLHQADNGAVFDTLLLFSDDRFKVLADEDSGGGVAIGLNTTFARLRTRWTAPLPGGWEHEFTFAAGPDSQSFEFGGEFEAYERAFVLQAREELSRPAEGGRALGGRVGLDVATGRETFLYDVTVFSPYEADEDCFVAPAAYAEAELHLGPVTLYPGLRADAIWLTSDYTAGTVDPRFNARWVPVDGTVVKAGVGRYSQFPTLRQVGTGPDADGNPDLVAAWSLQSSLGLEQRLGRGLSLEATGFYNHLDDLVVGREDRFRFFTGPPPVGPFDEDPYANDGTGEVYGLEALLKLSRDTTTGLASVTVSRSTRVDRPGEETQLFEYDQPVVMNLIASQELPRAWRVGARFRLASGNPYTPVVNRVFDAQSRAYFPVYGERDSARLPTFWCLDLRVDKEWTFKTWNLTTYLDVQNALNTKNVDVMSWTWDYAEEDPINGLPVVPSFGLKGEWGKGR